MTPPARRRRPTQSRTSVDRARSAAHRYRDDLRRYSRARLSHAEDDVSDEWPHFLGWSLIIGAVLIGSVQLLEWLTVNTSHQFARAVGVGFGLILAALGLAVLAWIYWRIQLDPEDRKPYVVAMLSSLATVGVCTAAFAGLTTTLWRQGVISSESPGVTPGLWRVEAFYLWHLIEAVPLLGVPEALRWEQPVVFSDPWSGGLLLGFKVLLLIPLLRVILSGFRLVQSAWLSAAERPTEKWRHRIRSAGFSSHEAPNARPHSVLQNLAMVAQRLFLVIAVIGLPLLAYGVLMLVIRRASLLDRWVSDHVPGQLEVFGVSASTSWLPTAMDVAGAWLVVAIAWSMAAELSSEYEQFLESYSVRRTAAAIFLSCWLLLLATMAAAAVTLTLLHAGPAETDAQLLPAQEVSASLQWYAWHLADTIPVLDVPQTLNWNVGVEFVDAWTGVLLVLMRMVLIAVLLVPFALITRLSVRHALRRRRGPTQADAAGEFMRILDESQAHLDRAQQKLLARGSGPRQTPNNNYHPDLYQATRTFRTLDHQLERVVALFGEGQVINAGRAAITALHQRVEAIQSAETELFFAGDDTRRIAVVQQSLDDSWQVAVAHRDEYQRLAGDALRTAATGPLTTSHQRRQADATSDERA
jgi:hypothetical protein